MPDRLYKLSYPDNPKRPIYIDDAGNLLNLSGLLIQGMGANIVMLAPNAETVEANDIIIVSPTLEEWCAYLDRSDDPLIFEEDNTGKIKAVHHKQQRVISGAVQQRIWHRDGWQCLYCGKRVPEILVTIDHFVPLELGGTDDESNYISCCRQDNKAKGNIDPLEYCKKKGLDYCGLKDYLAGKASKLFINHLQINP
jgi:hypothetical protein